MKRLQRWQDAQYSKEYYACLRPYKKDSLITKALNPRKLDPW